MLWCLLEGVVGSLTRFALIAHLFHGDGLCFVASTTYDTLKRRLPATILTGVVSEKVLSQISTVLATGLGLQIWWILDKSEGLGIFTSATDSLAQSHFSQTSQWV